MAVATGQSELADLLHWEGDQLAPYAAGHEELVVAGLYPGIVVEQTRALGAVNRFTMAGNATILRSGSPSSAVSEKDTALCLFFSLPFFAKTVPLHGGAAAGRHHR